MRKDEHPSRFINCTDVIESYAEVTDGYAATSDHHIENSTSSNHLQVYPQTKDLRHHLVTIKRARRALDIAMCLRIHLWTSTMKDTDKGSCAKMVQHFPVPPMNAQKEVSNGCSATFEFSKTHLSINNQQLAQAERGSFMSEKRLLTLTQGSPHQRTYRITSPREEIGCVCLFLLNAMVLITFHDDSSIILGLSETCGNGHLIFSEFIMIALNCQIHDETSCDCQTSIE